MGRRRRRMNSKQKTTGKVTSKATAVKEKSPVSSSTTSSETDLQKQLKECKAELVCFRAKFDPVEIEKYKIQNVTTEQMFQDALLNAERDLKIYEAGTSDNPMVKDLRLNLISKEKECGSLKQAAKYDAEEITILKRRCVSLDSDIVKLKSQIEALQKQLSSTDDVRKELESLQKEVEGFKKEKETLNQQFVAYQKLVGDKDVKERNLVQEKNSLKQDLSKAGTQIESLRSTNAQLSESIADLKYELSVSRSNEGGEVTAMRDRITKLEKDLTISEKESKESRTDAQQLKADLQQSREDYECTKTLKNKVEDELTKTQSDADTLRKELNAREVEIGNLKSKLSEYGAKGMSTSVDGRISEAERDNELGRLRAECKDLSRELEAEKDVHARTKREKEDLEMKCHDAFEKISQKERKLMELETHHTQTITRRDATIKQLRKEQTMVDPTANSKKDVSALETSNIRLLEQVEILKKENNELKSRKGNQNYSQANGDSADDNNPERLAERFSQLYNNEWSDIFKYCESENGSTRESAAKLLNALMDVYKFCQAQALRVPEKLLNSLQSLSKFKDTFDVTKMSSNRLLKLKEFTYIFAPDLTTTVIQEYMKDQSTSLTRKDLSDKYISKCVELCWLMCVQIPPMVLETSEESQDFDKTLFKLYKKDGQIIDFVVWPSVRLHKNGPILCKGLADGK